MVRLVVAGTVLAAGVALSIAMGESRRHDVIQDRSAGFQNTVHHLSASLGTELRRISDVVVVTGNLVEVTPSLTNASFDRWSTRTALDRHDGARGFGFVERIPAAALDGFLTDLAGDPTRPLPDDVAVVPAGSRDHYCIARFADNAARAATPGMPATFDLCADPAFDSVLTAIATSGEVAAFPLSPSDPSEAMAGDEPWARALDGKLFALFVPVYEGAPRDAIERRTTLRGWSIGIFDGPTIVRSTMRSDIGAIGLELRWTGLGPRSVVAGTPALDGPVFRSAESFQADSRWTLVVEGSAADAEHTARTEGMAVFGGGLAITLLLDLLLVTLLGSRNRALTMVDAKTDELRQQALHDALTGLPNRVLALDRLEQAIARARRDGTQPATLFLDLDNFKSINDTFGHAVGDELLRELAARLHSTVRESETLARLGGDEFLMVTDGEELGTGTELLAQRLLDSMMQPFVLDAFPTTPLTLSISIGVAVGNRDDASDLLRDADIALYAPRTRARGGSRSSRRRCRPSCTTAWRWISISTGRSTNTSSSSSTSRPWHSATAA